VEAAAGAPAAAGAAAEAELEAWLAGAAEDEEEADEAEAEGGGEEEEIDALLLEFGALVARVKAGTATEGELARAGWVKARLAEISSTLSQRGPDPPALLAHPAVPLEGLAPAGLGAPLSPELGGRLTTMHEEEGDEDSRSSSPSSLALQDDGEDDARGGEGEQPDDDEAPPRRGPSAIRPHPLTLPRRVTLIRGTHDSDEWQCALVYTGGVPLERVIKNTHFRAFPYQFGLCNDPF
jgi:hypothetical protein